MPYAQGIMEQLIASCGRCHIVDKPFVKHKAYSWLPSKVEVLAVGESPPPGRKDSVFYNLRLFDRLRLSMKLILNIEDDGDVLRRLKRSSTFLTAAVKCRPPSLKELQPMRRNCVYTLREELKLLKPARIVAMGRTASASIAEILKLNPPPTLNGIFETEVKSLKIAFTPHPNYIFRFRRDLAPKMKSLLNI
jgi:uracil-DNA glycosylase